MFSEKYAWFCSSFFFVKQHFFQNEWSSCNTGTECNSCADDCHWIWLLPLLQHRPWPRNLPLPLPFLEKVRIPLWRNMTPISPGMLFILFFYETCLSYLHKKKKNPWIHQMNNQINNWFLQYKKQHAQFFWFKISTPLSQQVHRWFFLTTIVG